MAQNLVTNPQDTSTADGHASGYMQQSYTQAVQTNPQTGELNANADGTHITGGADTDVARKLSNGLMKTNFDDVVCVGGFSGAYINAMSREFGSRQIKSMRYGFYSIGLRQVSGKVKFAAATQDKNVKLAAADVDKTAPKRVTVPVEDATIFDVTDVVTFDGISGYDENGNALQMVDLAARVCAIDAESATNSITVQFLNGKTYTAAVAYASYTEYNTANGTNLSSDEYAALSADKKVKTPAVGSIIPDETVIYINGHAAAETDASTTPYAALPERKEQFHQKFMVQSLISSVMEESDKEVKWGETEINDLLMQQFLEDIEKAYLKGVKSYTFDKVTKLWTYTTSGVIEQLVSGGGTVIVINKSQFNKSAILNLMTKVFIGNNGSEKRYMLTGIDFAKAFFEIADIKEYIDQNSTERKFEYDWTRLRFFNYIVNNAPDPLFDKLGMRNYALILDRQYVERRYFRSMDETDLELKATGKYDGKSTVWSEISSVILKNPTCHALIKLVG